MKKKLYLISLIFILPLATFACANQSEQQNQTSYHVDMEEENMQASDLIVPEPPVPPVEHAPLGDIWIRSDVDELLLTTTDVIRAEILDYWTEEINTWLIEEQIVEYGRILGRYIHTIYTLRVLEVFQGNTQAGDTVQVMQRGGTLEGRTLENPRHLPLNVGDDLIFFLFNFESDGFGHLPMGLAAGPQAVYQIPAINRDSFHIGIEAAFSQNHLIYDVALENLSPYNPITVTVRDLLQIVGADTHAINAIEETDNHETHELYSDLEDSENEE